MIESSGETFRRLRSLRKVPPTFFFTCFFLFRSTRQICSATSFILLTTLSSCRRLRVLLPHLSIIQINKSFRIFLKSSSELLLLLFLVLFLFGLSSSNPPFCVITQKLRNVSSRHHDKLPTSSAALRSQPQTPHSNRRTSLLGRTVLHGPSASLHQTR